MASFECHITIPVSHAEAGEALAKARGWKTSEIKRDPVLGDASHFYLTKHSSSVSTLFRDMENTELFLEMQEVPILRKKIEAILYDTKTGVGV